MRRTLGIVGAPSSAGAFGPGQEKAPSALRAAGLLDRLRRAGLSVVDHGDVPGFRWRPDPSRRDAQNIEAVTSAALAVSDKVRAARAAGEVVLVLGGDCTTELGTVLGHLTGDPALVYFDIHPDLNVPGAVPDGALDWMGVAHLIGEERGVPALRDIGPRSPLLPADRVLLFAQADRHSTAWERELIERRAMARITMDEVAPIRRPRRRTPSGTPRRGDEICLSTSTSTRSTSTTRRCRRTPGRTSGSASTWPCVPSPGCSPVPR